LYLAHARSIEILRNLGFAGGSNRGILNALGRGAQSIWLLFNDAKMAPNAFTGLLAEARRDPTLGCVGSLLATEDTGDRRHQGFRAFPMTVISPFLHGVLSTSMAVLALACNG
jgi:GT2 family glycosyltransferase